MYQAARLQDSRLVHKAFTGRLVTDSIYLIV